MSRAATADEWSTACVLVGKWLALCGEAMPALFDGAIIQVNDTAIHVELAGSEDVVIECAGTVDIWSARTSSLDAARVLAGVLLAVQYALSANAIQLSGSKANAWQAAATALTAVWGEPHVARIIAPRRYKADSLVYLEHGDNARIVRDYFRTQLELSEELLPDRDFKDVAVSD